MCVCLCVLGGAAWFVCQCYSAVAFFHASDSNDTNSSSRMGGRAVWRAGTQSHQGGVRSPPDCTARFCQLQPCFKLHPHKLSTVSHGTEPDHIYMAALIKFILVFCFFLISTVFIGLHKCLPAGQRPPEMCFFPYIYL